jgi:hypothetical protein
MNTSLANKLYLFYRKLKEKKWNTPSYMTWWNHTHPISSTTKPPTSEEPQNEETR